MLLCKRLCNTKRSPFQIEFLQPTFVGLEWETLVAGLFDKLGIALWKVVFNDQRCC